jgi:hypothetical protein
MLQCTGLAENYAVLKTFNKYISPSSNENYFLGEGFHTPYLMAKICILQRTKILCANIFFLVNDTFRNPPTPYSFATHTYIADFVFR